MMVPTCVARAHELHRPPPVFALRLTRPPAALLGLELASGARFLRLRDLVFTFSCSASELQPVALIALAAAALSGAPALSVHVGYCDEPAADSAANPFRELWAQRAPAATAGLAPWLQHRIHVAPRDCVLPELLRSVEAAAAAAAAATASPARGEPQQSPRTG